MRSQLNPGRYDHYDSTMARFLVQTEAGLEEAYAETGRAIKRWDLSEIHR
jgi:hypothetical protein